MLRQPQQNGTVVALADSRVGDQLELTDGRNFGCSVCAFRT
jgi:hypothetical protein